MIGFGVMQKYLTWMLHSELRLLRESIEEGNT